MRTGDHSPRRQWRFWRDAAEGGSGMDNGLLAHSVSSVVGTVQCSHKNSRRNLGGRFSAASWRRVSYPVFSMTTRFLNFPHSSPPFAQNSPFSSTLFINAFYNFSNNDWNVWCKFCVVRISWFTDIYGALRQPRRSFVSHARVSKPLQIGFLSKIWFDPLAQVAQHLLLFFVHLAVRTDGAKKQKSFHFHPKQNTYGS